MLGRASETELRIAVLIPCFNEETTVQKVVKDFKEAMPEATIYVYDNNSADDTAEAARQAGAIVRDARRQGKGNVVRRMFSDVDSDVYILVDGDATYDTSSASLMVEKLISEHLDMVVACRVDQEQEAFRPGHRLGNWILTRFVGQLFGQSFTDILSGYRVFSRRFVKSFPILTDGFEIETELTTHALQLAMPVGEVESFYFARPVGSVSKLNTWGDGFRILATIVKLWRSERPMMFFGLLSALALISAVILAVPLLQTFLESGTVPRLPTAVLVTGLMMLSALAFVAAVILDTVTRGRREMKLLSYLAHPSCSTDS